MDQGKGLGVPFFTDPLFDIVGRAASELAIDRDLISLGQGRLDEGDGCPKQRHYPEPENGAGAAQGNGGGHASDVAHAHTASSGHDKGAETGDPLIGALALVVTQQPEHLLDKPQLRKFHPHRKIDAGAQNQDNQRNTPDHIVDTCYNTL